MCVFVSRCTKFCSCHVGRINWNDKTTAIRATGARITPLTESQRCAGVRRAATVVSLREGKRGKMSVEKLRKL